MQRTNLNVEKYNGANLLNLAGVAILVTGCLAIPSAAQQPGQKTFSSPEDASHTLVTAAQTTTKSLCSLSWDRRKASCFVRR